MRIELYIQIFSSLVTLAGVIVAVLQLRRILHSVAISQQGNAVNVIAHCASRYEKIMSEIPACDDKGNVRNWCYRYWDLYTEEFNFFTKSLLDRDIFELWINELATVYQLPPNEGLKPRRESHREYLNTTLPYYTTMHEFYGELDAISKDPSPETRAKQVHELIVEFAR